jgi:hypothetical protein
MFTKDHSNGEQPKADRAETPVGGADGIGEASRSFAKQSGAIAGQVGSNVDAIVGGAARYGQQAMGRQMDAIRALADARTPEDVVRVQIDYGRRAFEAYVSEVRRMSDVMADLYLSSARNLSEQAARLQPPTPKAD